MSTWLPLSLAQHEVLQDQRAWPGSRHLLIGGYFSLRGPMNEAALATAVRQLAAEQPVLRLRPQVQGQALVSANDPAPPLWRRDEHADEAHEDAAVRAVWARWTEEHWDPATAPPWRVGWLRFDAQRSAILLLAHHSVLDGWGTAQMARRCAALYDAALNGTEPPPTDAGAYLRQIEDDAAYLHGDALAADAAFWKAHIPHLPPPLFPPRPVVLPSAQGPGPRQLPTSHLCSLNLDRASYQRWRSLADSGSQTEFATLAAVLAWHFGRLAGVDEVLIGVPTLNRRGAAHRQALGMYVGVLPLRLVLDPAQTPRELAAQAARQMRQAARHARFPASHLARQLGVARAGRDSAFDLLVSFERQDYTLQFGAATVVRTRQLFSGVSRYPLSVALCDFGAHHDLEWVLEGSAAVFDERALALTAQRLMALAEAFVDQPDRPLRQIPLLPPAEREAVLEGLHHDLATQPRAPSFVERFAAQAALHPLSPALVGDGFVMAYGELALRMRTLAQRLRAQGVQSGQVIPLVLPRGPELVTAMLAVARAGGCFVPLDPDWPEDRLRALLESLRPSLWLSETDPPERLRELHPGRLAIGGSAVIGDLPPYPTESCAAYALFTSGSTGAPKCVQVPHGALARRFAWLARAWSLGPGDRSLQGTQATFDPSLLELLLPLTVGGSVALPGPGRHAAQNLAGFAARHACTFTALVPATAARLLDGMDALPAELAHSLRLRVACCGGEVLPPALAQRWLRSTRAVLWNVYGPTEACIFATAWPCREGDPQEPLPVGSPVDDTRLYVLDPDGQPLPFGTPGEVWLGGPTLALGYLNDDEATAHAFQPDPFVSGGRRYRTGDRGWLDGEGRLHFLGRADRQVKIHGQRIEPGEVEAVLQALPGVSEAHVQAHAQPPGGPLRLHAWVAPARVDLGALQAGAKQRLPEAFRPTGWTVVDALPRNTAGKVDPERLPPPQAPVPALPRAPSTVLESELLALLCEALKRQDLGVDDDFFAVGGDSLAALDWLSAIEQRTGLHADLGTLAQAPTVAQLAPQLAGHLRPESRGLAIELSPWPAAPRVFLAASGHGDRLRFQALADALGPAARVQMLQPPPDLALTDLAELAARYGQQVASQAGAAPIRLAGFSVGGVTALETARWLQAHGVAVAHLVLIDSVYPRWILRQRWLWRLAGWLTRRLHVQELSMNGRRLGALFNDAGLVSQVLALHRYRPQAYDGPVWLLRSTGLARWQGFLFGPWRRRLRLREEPIQGLHGSVFEAGRVAGLAQCLSRALGLKA